MKVAFIKNDEYINYELNNLDGYKFTPKRKNINTILVTNNKLIKNILNKRIKKDIKNINKAIKFMIKNNVTEISDCILMDNEIKRIIKNINDKYLNYFNEFEYIEFIKKLYILNNTINLKKKLIETKEL